MLRLALIGFGTVSQGLAKLLVEKADRLAAEHGARFQVNAIATGRHGTLYDPQGLDLSAALHSVQSGGLNTYLGAQSDWDNLRIIREGEVDVVVENTPTDLVDGGPAMAHISSALERGKHVVTANKGPIALAYRRLSELARQNNAQLLFEGTVLSGTPILSLQRYGLGGCRITGVKGILNGTTNYILSQMESGLGYEDALQQAQALGFAEADPSADVDGWDALAKVVILANVVMGANLSVADVAREGITGITINDIEQAKVQGKRWKLIGQATMEEGQVTASVRPTLVEFSDPLAGVGAAMNALTFETDVLKSVTITGAGAGGPQTGFAVLSDLLELHRRLG